MLLCWLWMIATLAKLRWHACANNLPSLARMLLRLYLISQCTSRAKQWQPICVILCKFSRFCPCHRLPASEVSVKWIFIIQRSETVLQLLPWVICWWLVSTAHGLRDWNVDKYFYRGWKLGDMALWTSLRANQVAQRSLRRGRKLLSYLFDSHKSRPRILLPTNYRCIFLIVTQ